MNKFLEIALYEWVKSKLPDIPLTIGFPKPEFVKTNPTCSAVFCRGIVRIEDSIQCGTPYRVEEITGDVGHYKAYWPLADVLYKAEIHLVSPKRTAIDEYVNTLLAAVLENPCFYYNEGESDEILFQYENDFSTDEVLPGDRDESQERKFEVMITISARGPHFKTTYEYEVEELVVEVRASIDQTIEEMLGD